MIATPATLAWIDLPALRKSTDHTVRSEFRALDEPEFLPRGDAVLVAPATFNTINKVAVGLSDTLVLGLINEAIGSPTVPVALVPWVNASLSNHPAYGPSLRALRSAGAYIVDLAIQEPNAFDDAISDASAWLTTTAECRPPHAR